MKTISPPLVLFLFGAAIAHAADLKVVTLHPLLKDLVEKIGADRVEIVDLIGEKGDPHTFQPQPKQLVAAEGAKIYFASGMGLEAYLPKLKAILAGKARIVEVGANLPALYGKCEHEEHHHEHEQHLDPHWWHSVENFSRAAEIVSSELSSESPKNKAFFQANTKAYREKLDTLHQWVKREVIRIPKEQRKLATAHAAFQYFCEAYGFEAYPVQGINREQMPDTKKLAALIQTLKQERIIAIFPEKESNPKILENLTRDTSIRLGKELIADGRGVSHYEEMIRRNVSAIVSTLNAK